VLLSFARRQSIVSSGESEWYDGCSCVAEALYSRTLLDFLGFIGGIVLLMDSTAAKSFGSRQGVGKLRHLATKTLWLQQKIADNLVRARKVRGPEKPADIGTQVHDGLHLVSFRNIAGVADWT
jgi:hypothetical protein